MSWSCRKIKLNINRQDLYIKRSLLRFLLQLCSENNTLTKLTEAVLSYTHLLAKSRFIKHRGPKLEITPPDSR